MTWTITGDCRDVLLAVSVHGNAIVRGEGSHVPYIIDDDVWVDSEYPPIAEALQRLQRVNADWRILTTDAVQNEIIDNANLLEAIEASPGKSIGQISCIDNSSDKDPALSFNIALEPRTFQQVNELFTKLLIGFGEIHYTISIGFMTFRFPSSSAISAIPTLDEFKTGRPYFSDQVSISVCRSHSKDT